MFIIIISCYSHLFVVVTTDQNVIPYQVPDSDLVSYDKSVNTMYVAAVVYNTTGLQWKNKIVIGNGSRYNYNRIEYYSAPFMKGDIYYSFVRAYSFNHTETVSVMIHIFIYTIILCFGIAESKVFNKWLIRSN